jgi:hypothetical protein
MSINVLFCIFLICGCGTIRPDGLYVEHQLVKVDATYEDACDAIFNKRYPGKSVELLRNNKAVLSTGSK